MTWATPVPILVFLGLSVCSRLRRDVGYATDRRRTSEKKPSLKGGIIINHRAVMVETLESFKQSLNYIADPLSAVFNISLVYGVFSDRLKIAKVTLLFYRVS